MPPGWTGGRRGVGYAEFVRRRPFSDWRLPAASLARGRRCTRGLAHLRRLGLRGAPPSAVDGQRRPDEPHPSGASSWQRGRRGPRLGAAADDLRTDAAGRRPAAGRRSRARQPAGRPSVQRDEGPVIAVNISMGGGGGGLRLRTGPPRVPALGDTMMRTMLISSGGAVAAGARRRGLGHQHPDAGRRTAGVPPDGRPGRAGRAAARALLEQGGGDLGVPPARPR